MLAIEFFRLRRWTHDELVERLVLRGQEDFNLSWAPGNRGVLFLTAHFGSFEVLAALSRFLGVRGNLVVTGVPNRFVNRWMIFRRGGGESGLTTLPHKGIVHKCVKALRTGGMVVVLGDQRGDDTRPTWVNFFGRKVIANGVFARFAIDGKAPVLPLTAVRLDDGRYLCEFGEEIPIQRTGDRQRDLMVNSQRFHDVFEKWLREHPEQGFWMHRKFKRKPRRTRKRKAERRLVPQPAYVENET
jgi:KDO2-lipid IV(A) lauroyltransferase